MKKLIISLILVAMFSSSIYSVCINELNAEDKSNVVSYLEDKIYVPSGSTVEEMDKLEYEITEVSEDWIVVVSKDGEIYYIPKS